MALEPVRAITRNSDFVETAPEKKIISVNIFQGTQIDQIHTFIGPTVGQNFLRAGLSTSSHYLCNASTNEIVLSHYYFLFSYFIPPVFVVSHTHTQMVLVELKKRCFCVTGKQFILRNVSHLKVRNKR